MSKKNFTYSKLNIPKNFLDSFENKKGLRIDVKASHAGILTLNKKFYIPSIMMDGISSFKTGEKSTKIHKHHNIESDPVGIVKMAEFVPTISPELSNSPDILNLMSLTTDIKTQIKSVNNLMRSDFFKDSSFQGLGYARIIADILDPESIEQIKDGRFDAVSTNFSSPGKVFCSVCSDNLYTSEICDHKLGDIYETEDGNITCTYIPGCHVYNEVSLVGAGADPHTSIQILDAYIPSDGKLYSFSNGLIGNIDIIEDGCKFIDSIEESTMNLTEKLAALTEDQKKIYDLLKSGKIADDALAIETAITISSLRLKDGNLPFQVEAELDENTAILYQVDSILLKDKEIDPDSIYLEIEKELDLLNLKDSKLSTEQRNKLPDTKFCGPNRSFPITDCAHVLAAKKLIGRYEGPGNKSEILACISKKSNALGCSVPNKDNKQEDLVPDITEPKPTIVLTDEEVKSNYSVVESEMIKRGLKLTYECKDCLVLKDKINLLEQNNSTSKENIKKLEGHLSILRQEYKLLNSESSDQIDSLIALEAEVLKEKSEKIAIIGVLNKKYGNLKEAQNNIESVLDINQLELTIKDNFNLDEIVDKLNNGMSRVPEGTVVNPSNQEDKIPETYNRTQLVCIENIKDALKNKEKNTAENLFRTYKAMRIFSDTTKIEDISVEC